MEKLQHRLHGCQHSLAICARRDSPPLCSTRPDVWIFAMSYIAMVPSANLLGFAGQELARKLPRVFGILLEVSLSSVVEIVLFMFLIKKSSATGDVA